MSTSTAVHEISVSTHDGRTVLRWGLSSLDGLTVAGISRALQATGKWLDGLTAQERAAVAAVSPGIQISPQSWTMPCVRALEQKAADMMTGVLDQAGSIGRLPS